MRLDSRTLPHLPDAFPEEGRNPLSETHQITSAPFGKFRTVISGSFDLPRPDGRLLDFRMGPHLPAVFAEEGRILRLGTHKITTTPLGESRRLLPEIADLALSDGMRLNFRMIPHLPALFS